MTAFATRMDPTAERRTRFRWVICLLLFLITANNYFDRYLFGILGPQLAGLLHWSERDYTDIVFWFQVAYGAGFLVSGRFLDIIGSRRGMAWLVGVWSFAAMLPAGLSSLFGFKFARSLLGLAEPGHMPAAIKVVTEWFPRAERSLATGIYKAGSNLSAMFLPFIVPWMFVSWGWRPTFFITGVSGFILLVLWLWLYRPPGESPRVSPAELALIESEPVPPPRPATPWRVLLRHRETWGYALVKFMTDAIWHWYGAMFPLFLMKQFGLKLKDFGLPLFVLYLIADIGSIGGGGLATYWIKRGWSVTRARNAAMFLCCAAVLPAIYVPHTASVWLAVVIVGIAHAAHQGLTSNLFTTVSDMYPRQAIGSVVGLGGTAGQVGASLMTLATGWLLGHGHSFTALFTLAGTVYLVAFAFFRLMAPHYEPISLRT
jgi:ACS family hexuronate transporter-like MFS transporter